MQLQQHQLGSGLFQPQCSGSGCNATGMHRVNQSQVAGNLVPCKYSESTRFRESRSDCGKWLVARDRCASPSTRPTVFTRLMAFASSPQIASEPPVILQLPVTHGSPAAPFVGLAPPTVSVSDLDQNYNIISCSILVRRDSESNQEDVFQVIPRLAIHSSLKTPRGNASSVRIASLLQCLRTGIQFQSVVIENPLVTALITGTYPAPDSVGVSTTRVPDFSCNEYRGLTSGYQFFGELSQINLAVEHNHTQHSTAYTSGEIISTLLTPSSHDFFTIYGPMNVTPESNFILIFTVRNGSTTFLEPVLRHSQSFSESVLSFETDSIFSLDPSFHISDGFVSSQSGDSSPTSAYLEHINDAFQTPSFPDFSCITNWENCIVSPLDPQAESLGSASAQPHDTRETAIGENHGLHPSPQPVASSASVRYSPYSNRRRNRSSSAASVATRKHNPLAPPWSHTTSRTFCCPRCRIRGGRFVENDSES